MVYTERAEKAAVSRDASQVKKQTNKQKQCCKYTFSAAIQNALLKM